MRKNGFTLVEILAVIAILALLITLFIPNTIKLLKNNNLKLYKVKESQLVDAAKSYIYDSNFVEPTAGNPTYVTISQLAAGNYLSKILDSTSGNECSAFVRVRVSDINGYDYEPCIICEEYKTDKDFCSLATYNNL